MRGQGHKITTINNFFIYIHTFVIWISLESCWKELSNDIKIFEIEQKIKPGGSLLLDQGRSSGDFVSNFQPSYIKLFELETWNLVWDIFSSKPTNMPNFSKIGDGRQKNAEKGVS